MHLTCTNMPKEKVDIALRVSLIKPQLVNLASYTYSIQT